MTAKEVKEELLEELDEDIKYHLNLLENPTNKAELYVNSVLKEVERLKEKKDIINKYFKYD